MTTLLEKAFAEASKLSKREQDALAALLLAEMQSEGRWQRAFAESQGELAALADEALDEFRAGTAKPLDPDKL